jgi:HK97 family phage major capsid protein
MPTAPYSLANAFKGILEGNLTGFELETHQELVKLMPSKPAGFLIPLRATLKAQNVTSAPAGGFTVGSAVPMAADALRPASLAMRLGAEMISLRPNAIVPSIDVGAQGYWLAEGELCPESTASLKALKLTPKRCAAWMKVTNQLLAQAPIAESMLTRDLRGAIGQALDLGIFSGVGGHEPTGLLNSGAVQSYTFGGAPTRAKLAAMERKLGDENADDSSAQWVTSPAVREKWRNTVNNDTAGSGFLWDDDNRAIGKPAWATNSVPGDFVILGDFSDLLIVNWGVIEISDPFGAKRTAQTELLIEIHADAGPVRGKSFTVSTDTANQ